LYVFDLQVQGAIDYEIGNWYVSTHPNSPFLGQLKVALLAPGKRHTLNNAHYAIHSLDQPSEKRLLNNAQELTVLLRDTFGIRVPVQPSLAQAMAGGWPT
jgi:N-hydroxyarylamine O-acetyltransferase